MRLINYFYKTKMENIKVHMRVKPSNKNSPKLFNVIKGENNFSTLLNNKTGENFSFGKKISIILLKLFYCFRSSYTNINE